MGVKKLLLKGANLLKVKSPLVTAIVAMGGVVAVGVTAYKASKEVDKHLEEARKRKAEEESTEEATVEVDEVTLTTKEVLMATWKDLLPVVLIALCTMLCIGASYHISTKRNIAMAASMAAAEKAKNEILAKQEEILGKNKAEEIRTAVNQDHIDEAFEHIRSCESIPFAKYYPGDTVFYDSLTGQVFRSNVNGIREVLGRVSSQVIAEGGAVATEFYEEMGLQSGKATDDYGWDAADIRGSITPRFTHHEVIVNGQRVLCWCLDLDLSNKYGHMYTDSFRV